MDTVITVLIVIFVIWTMLPLNWAPISVLFRSVKCVSSSCCFTLGPLADNI